MDKAEHVKRLVDYFSRLNFEGVKIHSVANMGDVRGRCDILFSPFSDQHNRGWYRTDRVDLIKSVITLRRKSPEKVENLLKIYCGKQWCQYIRLLDLVEKHLESHHG